MNAKKKRRSFLEKHFGISKCRKCNNTYMIPVNVEQWHWVGIKLDFSKREVKYYDGLGKSAEIIINQILAFMMVLQALFLVESGDTNFGVWHYLDADKSDQPFQDYNNDDCGVIYCLSIWRMYLMLDTGTIGH